MADLVIAGAGGFGRELAAYARNAGFVVAGFLDDDLGAAARLSGDDAAAGLIGRVGSYEPRSGQTVAIGVGHPSTRVALGETLVAVGARLATVVHPSAWIAPDATIGEGVAIAPFACIGPGAVVGDLTLLNTYTSLGHDARVGRGCVMSPYSVLNGFAVAEDEVFLASHAVVGPSTRVGRRARLSGGAVALHDVPEDALAAGAPARAARAGGAGIVTGVAVSFWLAVALLVYTHAGYLVLLATIAWLRDSLGRAEPGGAAPVEPLRFVSIIVPAYREESVIADRVANLKALDYPDDRYEVIVSVDGSPDRTAEVAAAAGADVVLERPREGKVCAQDAGVEAARGEILAFGDANSSWEPGALRALVSALADPRVGYVCGDVRFINPGGTNQEGLYWRYEMAHRRLESRLRSVTAGNGAIYATRRESYLRLGPDMGHDLAFPFNMVRRGYRALYEPRARATELMIPSVEGEFARKRRFTGHTWSIVLRGGMLSPRGYGALYALMIYSHRVLRYASPLLHVVVLAANVVLLGQGMVYLVTLGLQVALLAAAALARVAPFPPMLVARYYVLTTFSLAAALWDWLAKRTPAGWDPMQEIR